MYIYHKQHALCKSSGHMFFTCCSPFPEVAFKAPRPVVICFYTHFSNFPQGNCTFHGSQASNHMFFHASHRFPKELHLFHIFPGKMHLSKKITTITPHSLSENCTCHFAEDKCTVQGSQAKVHKYFTILLHLAEGKNALVKVPKQ